MKKFTFLAIAAIVAFAASCNQPSKYAGLEIEAPLPSEGEIDSLSYYIGVNVGSFLANFGESKSDFNWSEVEKGINDFLKAKGAPGSEEFDSQLKLNPMMMNQVFNSVASKRQAYKAEGNLKLEEIFLAENKVKEGVDTTASGLQYILHAEGEGEKIAAEDTVIVNYVGTLLDGTKFDGNDSTEFVANRVIKGWTEGLSLMGKGGKATLYIPSALGYGTRGAGALIEPNSTLIFEVEVVDVKKAVKEEEETETK